MSSKKELSVFICKNFTQTYWIFNTYINNFYDLFLVLNGPGDNGEEIYLSADDDSGENYKKKIKIRLEEGKEYVVRIRLYTQWGTGNTSIIIY